MADIFDSVFGGKNQQEFREEKIDFGWTTNMNGKDWVEEKRPLRATEYELKNFLELTLNVSSSVKCVAYDRRLSVTSCRWFEYSYYHEHIQQWSEFYFLKFHIERIIEFRLKSMFTMTR